MSTATVQTGQRKRKLDSVSESKSKRRRSNETTSKLTEEHQRFSLLQEQMSTIVVPRLDAPTEIGDSGAIPACSTTIGRHDSINPEDDLSDSELSTDLETSSDSDITSSESDEEDEEEEENSNHGSTMDDATSGRHSLNDEIDIVSVPTQIKPAISSSASPSGSSHLRSRIVNFLPQLRKANEDLVNASDDMRIDAIADGQDQYIEMDLGLGVLKEMRKPRLPIGEIQTRDSSTSSDSNSSSDAETETEGSGEDPMRNLSGRKEKGRRQGRPVIQPLDDT